MPAASAAAVTRIAVVGEGAVAEDLAGGLAAAGLAVVRLGTGADPAPLAGCALIAEAAGDRLDVKQALYDRLDAVRPENSVVLSCTSGLPLALLAAGRAGRLAADLIIAHVAGATRPAPMVELAAGPLSRPEAVAAATALFLRLGRTVIRLADRPGLVADRLGLFWLATALAAAPDFGLTAGAADAVLVRALGLPAGGLRRLARRAGDPGERAARLAAMLGPDDPLRRVADLPPPAARDGFADAAGLPALAEAEDVAALVAHPSADGRYARHVLGLTLGYAAHLVGDAAPDIVAVDTAMRLAWDWRDGPFALADRLGIDRVAGLLAAGDVAPAPILAAAAGRPLYRLEGRRRQFLDLSGDYRDVAASAVTAPKT